MSSLSDFISLGSGAVKTAYYTTSGSKVLVPHGGKDKLAYLVRGENDGYWVRADGEPLYERDVVKLTADFGVDVGIGADEVGTVQGSFASPGSTTTGLAFDPISRNNISCDAGADLISVHAGGSSTVLYSFPSPATPTGITVDDSGRLVVCSNATNTIYVMDGISSTVLTSFPSPDDFPYGLTFDARNKNLISCGSGTIYVHDGVTSTLIDSFASANPEIDGIGYDSVLDSLITSGRTSSDIRIHQGISSTVLSIFVSPSISILGLTLNSIGDMLICSTAQIYTLTGPSQRPYAAIRYITQEI